MVRVKHGAIKSTCPHADDDHGPRRSHRINIEPFFVFFVNLRILLFWYFIFDFYYPVINEISIKVNDDVQFLGKTHFEAPQGVCGQWSGEE